MTHDMKQRMIGQLRTLSASRRPGRPALRSHGTRLDDAIRGQEAYKQVQIQKAIGQKLGLASPFFRCHTGARTDVTCVGGRQVLNFASYDYLGLNHHSEVLNAVQRATSMYGVSATASRLVAGERPVHRELELELASIYGSEDAIVMVSGHATNVNVLRQLVGEKDLVIHDDLIHNSCLEGALLSRASRRSFPHNDFTALGALLERLRHKHRHVLIVVEGLYSMDGDMPDLAQLVDLKKQFGAWIMVDEAHALGTLGARGFGSWEEQGIDPSDIDVWMGTLSKTLSACGGFIAGSSTLIEYIKCTAPGFVYSVGLSPALAAGASAALRILIREPERVAKLRQNCRAFARLAKSLGLATGFSQGHAIAPVMVGSSLRAVTASVELLDQGVNVLPVIYPAVGEADARLRFFLTSEHEQGQIEQALHSVATVLGRLPAEEFSPAAVARKLL